MSGSGASSGGGGSDAKIVSKFSEEFDINKIMEEHDKELMEGLQDVDEMDFVQMNSTVQAADNQDVKKGGADTVLNYLTKDQGDSSDDDMDEEEDGAAMNAQMAQADDFDFDQE